MGFFKSKNANGNEEQSPNDLENPLPRKKRSSALQNSRGSSGAPLGRTGSGRSVSASAKTIKVGSTLRTSFGGSQNTMTTKNSSSRTQTVNNSFDKIKATFNGDLSFRSFVSDLDLESPEMTPIGESSEDELKRIAGLLPLQDTEGSSDLYPSADFTLISAENQNCGNSKFSGANASKGSRSRSLVEDNASSAEFYDNVSLAGASVMMDKNRAENVGRSGTRFVYIVLLITGIIVSVMINLFARNYEYKNFELEFRSLARETADLAETNAEHTFSQLQTLATTVTSEGLLERERLRAINHKNYSDLEGSWPNVTIPHFDKRIDDFSESFGAIMLLYVPLVEAKDKDLWEMYANMHAPWEANLNDIHPIHTSLISSPSLNGNTNASVGDVISEESEMGDMNSTMGHAMNHTRDGSGRRRMGHDYSQGSNHSSTVDGFLKIHSCAHLDMDIAQERFFDVHEFEDEVLTDFGGFLNPQGLSAPIYQYGGPGHERTHNSYIALMDLMTHPIFKKEVIASIEYDVPVISEYMDVNFLLEGLSNVDPDDGNAASLLFNTDHSVYLNQGNNVADPDASNVTLPSIRSMTLHPVKDSFEPNATTTGFVVGVVPWHAFFKNVLKTATTGVTAGTTTVASDGEKKEVNGIVVVVTSDCGSVFTFVLNNRDQTTEVRLGDWTEQYENFQHLNHTSKFFWKEHAKGRSKHCHFDLKIYPNAEFRSEYREGSVIIYSSIVGGIFLFTALLFACYDHFIFKGQQHIVNEASGMVVQNARRAAKNERGKPKFFSQLIACLWNAVVQLSPYFSPADLNDFIAHEVRNPLAAAISACSFVSSAIIEDQEQGKKGDSINGEEERVALIASEEKRKEVQDDIQIIDSSLHFINDLLRNMLDIQRAGSNQINVERKPTNIMDDIFKPVQAMLHLRDSPFKITMEVDSGLHSGDGEDDNQLVVMTDSMRLKQVLLNLVRNATKFVEKGFIRCSANVNPLNGLVELRVDDSGPGIPPEKRSRVFGKFQQSLDLLQQGTGIGLSLCKKMITMMGGSLFIDEDYNSGIEGCRGTRFVIQLNIAPLQLNEMVFEPEMPAHERARLRRRHLLACTETSNTAEYSQPLPIEKQTSSLGSSTREISFKDESEEVIFLQELDDKPTIPADDDVKLTEMEEAVDMEQEANMLPLPTALQLAPAGDAIPSLPSDIPDEDQSGKLTELPKNLSVLFVDDDMVLRKLFSRTLRKINPTWKCKEASSGEMAIELISSNAECSQGFQDEHDEVKREEGDCGFDLIFMDQYMASVQKQLLGTETVRKIRANGFQRPIICGLSANDVEVAFYHAGSDAFMFKPFPCKKDELEKELLKVLNSRENSFLTSKEEGIATGVA